MVCHKNSRNLPFIYLINNDVTLTPVDSARNLGVIFDNNLTVSQHISAVSKSCFHDNRDLGRVRNTIDLTTARSLLSLPLSSILKLTIATLYYSIFLLLKLVVFNSFSSRLHVPSPKHLSFIISLLF